MGLPPRYLDGYDDGDDGKRDDDFALSMKELRIMLGGFPSVEVFLSMFGVLF